MGKVTFRPHIGPHKSCGFKLYLQRPRARAIVSSSVNMPLAPVRNLGVYVSFASRVRARLDYLHGNGAYPCARTRAGLFMHIFVMVTRSSIRND